MLAERKTQALHWRALCALIETGAVRFGNREEPELNAAVIEWNLHNPPPRRLLTPDTPPAPHVVFLAAPGRLLGPDSGRRDVYNPRDGAFYHSQAWRLDPYRDKIAKRLARALRGEWRLNPQGYVRPGEPVWVAPAERRYRLWRDHLDDAGIDPHENFEGRPSAFINALESQVDRLAACSVVGDISAGGWKPGSKNAHLYHPDDRDLRLHLPQRGRLEKFLGLRVHFPPPKPVATSLLPALKKRQGRQSQRQSREEPKPPST